MKYVIVILSLSLCLFAVGCHRLTPTQEAGIQHGTAAVGTVFGLPPIVGETLGAAIVGLIGAFAGHKNGRRCERKKAKAL